MPLQTSIREMNLGNSHTITIQGVTYDVEYLVHMAEPIELVQIPLSELEIYLHDEVWEHCTPASFLRPTMEECCIDHEMRIRDANIAHPLLFDARHELLDGSHRIVKGFRLRVETLPAKVISNFLMSRPTTAHQDFLCHAERLAGLLAALGQVVIPPSLVLDLIGLYAGHKVVGRTDFSCRPSIGSVSSVLREHGIFTLAHNDNLYFGLDEELLVCCATVDSSEIHHVFRLGGLFGYPTCCSLAAAYVSESALDEYSETMTKACSERTNSRMISPGGYSDGSCLISHIPCSSLCAPSFAIAEANLKVLRRKEIVEILQKFWPGYLRLL